MIVLALDTATPQVGVAVLGPDGVLARYSTDRGMRHAERLVPFVQLALGEAEVALAELDLIAVDVGPGLYTGLRVGVATANALARAVGVPVAGVSSLEALAAGASGFSGLVVPVIDARRGEVFSATYRWVDGAPLAVSPPRLVRPDTLGGELAAEDEPVALIGDGVLRYRACFDPVRQGNIWPLPLARPDPALVAWLAAERFGAPAGYEAGGEVQPVYLRDPDAVARFGSAGSAEHVR